MSGHLSLKWNNHSKAFIKSIGNIQIKERYCDATVVCQGRYFPVHRMILSTCSDYFDEMFERIKCQHPYVVFKDIEPEEMELLLNYMYQGEVNVVQERLPSLINAAEALKIKGLAVPDDLPSGKESNRKRSNNSEESPSRRREDNKRRRSSTTLSDSRDSSQLGHESNRVSTDDTPHLTTSSNEEGLKVIKEEPIDVEAYDDQPLQNVFGQATALESSPDISMSGNKILPSFPDGTDEENSIFLKNENDAGSNAPLREAEYDEQDSSWSDYTSGSALPNLPPFELSNQEDILHMDRFSEEIGHSSNESHNPALSEVATQNWTVCRSSPHILRNSSSFKCRFCDYESGHVGNVQRHVKFKHTLERPFPCQICPKRFTEKIALERHMRVHTGEKPFLCPNCPKRFRLKGGLNYHQRSFHNM